MPPLEHADCIEDAVLWPPAGKKGDGTWYVAAGSHEEILVRWSNALRTGTDPKGNTVTTTVQIAAVRKVDGVPVRIALGSLIWLGSLDDIPGTSNEPTGDIWEVVTESTAKDVKGRDQRFEYGLMRAHNRLPTG